MIGGKKFFAFEVTWPPSAPSLDSKDDTGLFGEMEHVSDRANERAPSEDSNTGFRVAALALGGVVVGSLTAGVGLLAGLVVVGVGAAAGGSAVALAQLQPPSRKPEVLSLAVESVEEAKAWVQAIKSQIEDLILLRNGSDAAIPKAPSAVDILEIENWITSTKWRVDSFMDGLRIYTLPQDEPSRFRGSFMSTWLTPKFPPLPCKRVCMPMNASPIQVYECIREFPPSCCTGVIKSLRIVEVIDRFTDVVHLVLNEVYLAPTWTGSPPLSACLQLYPFSPNNDLRSPERFLPGAIRQAKCGRQLRGLSGFGEPWRLSLDPRYHSSRAACRLSHIAAP